MKKMEIIKMVISILIIIVLATLIVNINKVSEKIAKGEIKESVNKIRENVDIAQRDYDKCFSDYGELPTTIVFIYSDYCPYCRNMMPIVKELENEGYKFYLVGGSDNTAKEIVTNCFGNLMSGYVPEFICPKTGEEQTGEMSKEDLKKFADNCKA